jgi:diguanylate cyclase (GGDEF)-like protein
MRSVARRTHAALDASDEVPGGPAVAEHSLSAVIAGSDPMSRRRAVLTWAAEQASVEEVVAGFVAARRVLPGASTEDLSLADELDVLLGEAVRIVSERAVRQALTDPLTGFGTRRSFTEGLAQALATADRTNEPVVVVLADIDGLKQINDTRGHAAGDDVIQRLAHTIRRCLRPEDAAYRIGGDEIVLLLPGATADATAAMRRRLEAAGAPPASLGWAMYPDETRDPQRLLEIADSRLYSSKRARRHSGGRRRRRDAPLVRVAVVAAALVGTVSGVASAVALKGHRSSAAPTSRSALHDHAAPPGAAALRGQDHVAPTHQSATKGKAAPPAHRLDAVPAARPPAATHRQRMVVPTTLPGLGMAPLQTPSAAPSPQPVQPLAFVLTTTRALLCTVLCHLPSL